MNTRLLIIAGLFVAISTGDMMASPEAMLTLRLVDDEGLPLTNMTARIGFFEGKQNVGTTDTNGMFSSRGRAISGQATFSVNEDGFYYGHGVYRFPKAGQPWSDFVKDDKWLPWDPVVTMVVKKIVDPIPMYARRVETTIPATNTSFGYDLMVGDWVKPSGKGTVNDLVFQLNGYWMDYRNNDSTLSITFSNPSDGLIPVEYELLYGRPAGSALFMPRHAPEQGYISEYRWRKARNQAVGDAQDESVNDLKEGRGYIFRVRSVTNDEGVVTNAFYGKISEEFNYGGAGINGGYLVFTYYLNPTPNDRNMEFDPKQNLFTDLKVGEQVQEP